MNEILRGMKNKFKNTDITKEYAFVHSDIKIDNILLDFPVNKDNPRVQYIDFDTSEWT